MGASREGNSSCKRHGHKLKSHFPRTPAVNLRNAPRSVNGFRQFGRLPPGFVFVHTQRNKKYPSLCVDTRRYPPDSNRPDAFPALPKALGTPADAFCGRKLADSVVVRLLPKKNRTRDKAGRSGTSEANAVHRELFPRRGRCDHGWHALPRVDKGTVVRAKLRAFALVRVAVTSHSASFVHDGASCQ